jgi:replicative DNA helicase
MADVIGNERLRYIHMPLTVEKIAAAIAQRKPRLVVVDHLGKVQGDGKRERRLELEDIVQRLGDIAIAHEVAMMVTTPVAKTATEDSAIGTITRDSNRLDFDAETYVSLWVSNQDREKDPRAVRMVLNKTRSGHEAKVPLMFTGSGQAFYSTEPAPEPYDEFAGFAHEGAR